MKNSTPTSTLIFITGIFLLACALLPAPSTTFETPPTSTSAPSLPTEESTGSGLENENLLAGVPKGFKIDYEGEQNNIVISEMVPQNESVNDWTTLVTVQIFLGKTDITPQQYQETLTQSWFSACPDSGSFPVADGVENGYNFVLWQLFCPLNPSTQKVEYTFLKAIQGNDSFYLVQVAFRFEPTEDDITRWMGYLKDVQVCDSRIPKQACP